MLVVSYGVQPLFVLVRFPLITLFVSLTTWILYQGSES